MLPLHYSVLLLSRVTFENSWRPIQSVQFATSGLTPVNASLVNEASPLDFWARIYGLLASPNYAIGISPLHCSGTNCSSYFLPGAIYEIEGIDLPLSFHPEASLLVVDNLIGYQIEYYPLAIEEWSDETMNWYSASSTSRSTVHPNKRIGISTSRKHFWLSMLTRMNDLDVPRSISNMVPSPFYPTSPWLHHLSPESNARWQSRAGETRFKTSRSTVQKRQNDIAQQSRSWQQPETIWHL